MVGRNHSANWTVVLIAIGAVMLFSLPAVAQYGKGKDKGRGQGRKHMMDAAPAVGDAAPNFKLKMREGEDEVELSSFQGKKPVVLVFGSYT